MSMSNTFENDLAKLIFYGTTIANLADNAAVSPLTSLYVSLHTDDPGEGGNQTTNEATYTNYARVAVLRSLLGWTISGAIVTNAALVQFPTCTGGTNTITYLGIGTDPTGPGKLMFSGALTDAIAILNLLQPQFLIGNINITFD